ncbi:MAG: hypothetical protein ACRELB_19055, partial [Polyangiaceae bacterium]
MRFPIRFEPAFRLLCKGIFLAPDDAHLDIGEDLVHVRFAWGFRSTFPRSSVASTAVYARRPVSRGVHGWAGKWLVNGAGDRILAIDLEPAQ